MSGSLRDPRFAFLVIGQSVNSVGSWASAIVLWGFAAYRFNASPEAISVTVVCWSVPPVILSPLTGGLTDRFGPRAMLIAGYLAAAAAALAMAAAGSLAFLDVMAAAYGVARSLSGPAGTALPPRIVAPDDLLAANSLLNVTSSIGQVAGPLAASALLAAAGFSAAFAADAATYLVGVVALLPLRLRPAPAAEPDKPDERGGQPRLRAAFAGAEAVALDPGLRRVALAGMGVVFTSGAFLIVEPLYARHVLGRPPSQFALFEAAIGAGAIVTGLALPRIGRRWPGGGTTTALAAGAIGYGLAAALFTGTRWIPVAYVGAFAWGASGMVFFTVAATALQRLAPAGTLGRVAGVISTAESAAETAGMAAAGPIVGVAGIRLGALALAAVAISAGAGCLRRRAPASLLQIPLIEGIAAGKDFNQPLAFAARRVNLALSGVAAGDACSRMSLERARGEDQWIAHRAGNNKTHQTGSVRAAVLSWCPSRSRCGSTKCLPSRRLRLPRPMTLLIRVSPVIREPRSPPSGPSYPIGCFHRRPPRSRPRIR
jgi:predicted MFS family arabinose efflux permease